MKDTQELPRMRGGGGTDSEGPSKTEEETPTSCLPLGGGRTGAWRDKEGPDGRGGFVVRMHTAWSQTVRTRPGDISDLLSGWRLRVLTSSYSRCSMQECTSSGVRPPWVLVLASQPGQSL